MKIIEIKGKKTAAVMSCSLTTKQCKCGSYYGNSR